MTTEQRLIEAFEEARHFQPSPDLWDRVVHSIDEDRAHRRRVIISTLVTLGVLAAALLIGFFSLETRTFANALARARVDWRVMEGLESGVLVLLTAVLAPAIRRFGRGYVNDLLHSSPDSGTRLLGLLDTAFYLVLGGYTLMTASFSPTDSYYLSHLGGQVGEAAWRIGGLLLLTGVLHATTLMVLPLISLVFNANRVGAKLPRWITIIMLLLVLDLVGGVVLASVGTFGSGLGT